MTPQLSPASQAILDSAKTARSRALLAVEVERLLRHKRRLDERRSVYGDPWRYIRDVLRLTLTAEQERIVELCETEDRVIVPSGNNLGKTLVAAGIVLYRFDIAASMPDEEAGLEQQGCRVLLIGPDHGTIQRTIYAEVLKLSDRAEANGWELPPGRSRRSVSWSVDGPAIWVMEPFSPAREAGRRVSSKASGRHHRNQLAVIEEAMGVEEATWSGGEGMCSTAGNGILAVLNPTETTTAVGTAAFLRSRGEAGDKPYAVIYLSAFDHPNVRERRSVIPDAIDHTVIDERVRLQCDDLGPRERVSADARRPHDFEYALPPPGAAEKGGRDDGIPGHPEGTPHVYRPSSRFVAQVLGQFSEEGSSRLFSPVYWDQATARWKAGSDPAEAPDRVAIDAAREGGDEIIAAPMWGNTAAEYLEAWRTTEKMTGGDPARAAELQATLQAHRARIGELAVIPPGTGPEVASRIDQRFPKSPMAVDMGGGASVYDHLRSVLGREVGEVYFGSSPDDPIENEDVALNLRAQMYLRFAALIRRGLVDVPPDPMLRQEAMVTWSETLQRSVELPGGRKETVTVWKIASKDEIKEKLGRSPDRLDAVVMAPTPLRLRDQIGSFPKW